jgi:predicted nucleic acid-binding Zn ribbon protein
MPLYEYQWARGHSFEVVRGVSENPVTKCSVWARRLISQPVLVHNRGIQVFDRQTKDDVLRNRTSSLKSLRKR